MVSDELLFSFLQVCVVYIYGLIGFLGIVFNVTNIIVFTKLGFSDTTNISLLGLAVADIGVSLPIFGYSLTNTPFIGVLLGNSLRGAILAIEGSAHVMFCRIAGLLTAFLAMERFICVAWPLRIKRLVTPKLSVFVVISTFAIMTSCNIPFSLTEQIVPRYDPQLNTTVLGFLLVPNGEHLKNITITIQVVAQVTSLAVVIVSTLGLIRTLHKISKWRKSVGVHANVSRKEKQLVKLVILISTVFIVCSLPTVVGNLAMVFVKDFNIQGIHRNLFLLVFLIIFILSTINSVVNIFIYVNMSSRFRDKLYSLVKLM